MNMTLHKSPFETRSIAQAFGRLANDAACVWLCGRETGLGHDRQPELGYPGMT